MDKCIEEIEERLEFVRYDVMKKEFLIYKLKEIGCKNHAISVLNFKTYINMCLGKTSVTVSKPFEKIPCIISADVKNNLKPNKKLDEKTIKGELEKYFYDKGYIDAAIMTPKNVDDLRDFLFGFGIKQLNGKAYKNVNTAINPYGFAIKTGHHKGDLSKIIII